jgi:hypothetical protein
MKKLKLEIDALTVDTFDTGREAGAEGGTVHARGDSRTLKIVCEISTLKTDLTCCPCTPMF